ncbi:uncharacterized protein EI90DRAFT_1258321 [Cantharellus anzutake]|uniref:uncharacterized protein n=1 Tax=Cantharellus anzutake TaxID=1750568 RepID=UPI001902DBDF|nr:uncharacterized protein EI90DRAFT_1258321 [Cantharellus anzutake]KAF8330029.1 hypothetical protein EI90DRAFT_1258321 [Cantharellus anzutake]
MAAVPAWTLENASTSSDSASSDSHTPMILGVSERGVPRRWAAANVDRKRYRDSPSDEDEDVTVEKDLSQSRSKIRTMKSRMKARKTVTSSSRSLKPLTPSDRPVDSTSVPAAHVGDYNLSKKQLSFTPKKKSRVTASNTTATPTSSVPVASVTFDIHNDITVEIPPAIYQPAKSNPPSTNKPPSNRSLCEHASIPTNSPTPSSSPLSSPPSITTTPLRQQQQAPYSPCPVTPTHSFMPSLSQRSNLPSELLSSPSPPPTDEAVASFLPEIAQLIWVRISKDGEISEDGELWWPAQVRV